MWGRVIEMATAVWLAASPYIFGVQDQAAIVWADSLLALLIVVLAGSSYWKPTRHAHLLILAVAAGLVVWGRFSQGTPPPPFHQNHFAIGIFLLMIALIPNEASQPPPVWRQVIEPPKRDA